MLLQKMMTAEEFDAFVDLPENADKTFEFIDGVIIDVPSNLFSSQMGLRIGARVLIFVESKNLGIVTSEQAGYIVAGARLSPDVTFLRRDRLPKDYTRGYCPVAPDLAVEVILPSDEPADIQKKFEKYAEAGVVVWAFYPKRKQVDVHQPGQALQTLGIDDDLDGGDILPGFKLGSVDILA